MLSVCPVASGPAAAGYTETDWEDSQVPVCPCCLKHASFSYSCIAESRHFTNTAMLKAEILGTALQNTSRAVVFHSDQCQAPGPPAPRATHLVQHRYQIHLKLGTEASKTTSTFHRSCRGLRTWVWQPVKLFL